MVLAFKNQTFELNVVALEEPVTIERFEVLANVEPYFFDLTDEVTGLEIERAHRVSFALPINLDVRKTYNIMATVIVSEGSTGQCQAIGVSSVTAGYDLPTPP